MNAGSYFGVGFMRGLNSVAEAFAPYPGGCDDLPIGRTRSDGAGVREKTKNALGAAFAKISTGVSERQLTESRRSSRPITRFVSARWRCPLPPATELEKIDQIVPGAVERLLRMAEQDLEAALRMAEQDLQATLQMAEKDLQATLQLAEKEQAYRIENSRRGHEDSTRGQWLGWFLAAGALTAAAVVSLFHAPWQVSVALVGIPVCGAVQALIQGRKDKGAGRTARWF